MTTTKEAQARKERGMRIAASNNPLLYLARKIAVELAEQHPDRLCTMDDVQNGLVDSGYSDRDLGNAAGSVFRGRQWIFTGQRIRSDRPQSHRNELKVWRLS